MSQRIADSLEVLDLIQQIAQQNELELYKFLVGDEAFKSAMQQSLKMFKV